MKRKWKYWQDDWPTARTYKEVLLDNKEKADKQLAEAKAAKTHFCRFNGIRLL